MNTHPHQSSEMNTPHRCTDHHRAKRVADEGPMFFSAGEYAAGALGWALLMAAGLALHLTGHRPGAEGATTGSVVMSVAVIPAGIVMALMERRRTAPTGSKDAA